MRKNEQEDIFYQCAEDILTTLGTDVRLKYAWAIREANGEPYIYLYKRKGPKILGRGFTKYNKDNFITAFPVNNILPFVKRYTSKDTL